MTYYAKAAIALAFLLAGFVGGWQVRGWKAAHDDAQRLETEAHDAKRRSEQSIAAAASYEADKAAQRPKTIIVTREVARAVQADPDCAQRPLPVGLRDALVRAAGGDQSLPDGAVPVARAARADDLGRARDRLFRALGGTRGLPGPASAAR